MAKERIFLEITDEKSHVELNGSAISIVANLCRLFDTHEQVKSLFKSAIEITEKVKNEPPKTTKSTTTNA